MNKDFDIDKITVNSVVIHKSLGECIVKKITDRFITVYCKSKHREMNFDFPNAFFDGYLQVNVENNSSNNIVFSDNSADASLIKKRKFSTSIAKKKVDYYYNAENIVGKFVLKKDATRGIIVEYIDDGANREGYVVVKSDNSMAKFMYPSCFEKGFLSFENDSDYEYIKNDIEMFKLNDKNVIEKEKQNIKDKILLINELSEHLSCVKKADCIENFCKMNQAAIFQEIQYMKTRGNKKYKILNGTEVTRVGDRFVYSFETEVELPLSPDFAINIFIKEEMISGIVISCEDNYIMFSSNKLKAENLKELQISFDAWFIMENLISRLEELTEKNNDIVKQLVFGNTKVNADSELKFGQDNAIKMATTNPITYIWGPPGTGKTYTLADIVCKLMSQNKRILMLSYSNVSVDGAILEVAQHCEDIDVGRIVRYGYPKDKSLLNSENLLTSYNIALSKNIELKRHQKELIYEKEKTDKNTARYKDIQEELKKIRSKIKGDENEIVSNAMFVATTLSKAVCDKQVYGQRFDAVIIDEVSMAYIPQIVFAANLAKEHFCCIGDFNQLPPIVQNDNEKSILKRDIFEYCGDLNNMVILNSQRRMHKNIAKFISSNMYFNLLESHESTVKREEITNCAPFEKRPIVYVDIHDLASNTRITGTSHTNIISALVTVKIAEKSMENNSFNIGIITPYNEQSKLINSFLQVLLDEESKNRIVCATVHQFQGSQRDIIIYDATDARGEIQYPGALLVSAKHNISNRLFNVAMTRARGKFIVVADREFIDSGLTKGRTEKSRKNKSLFYSLSQLSKNTNGIFNATDLDFLTEYEPSKNIVSFLANKQSFDLYNSDLRCARNKVRFDINSKLSTYGFNEKYLKAIEVLEKNEIKTTVFIDEYANTEESYSTYVKKKLYTLTNLTIVDDEIIWIGDPLKKKSLCWRIKGKNAVSRINNTI